MAMACSPEEQKRFTVVPATDTGKPARMAATRATFDPCGPCGMRAAQHHVFDFGGIELRRLGQDISDAMRRQIFGPRHVERAAKDLASAVRELATTTASLMSPPGGRYAAPPRPWQVGERFAFFGQLLQQRRGRPQLCRAAVSKLADALDTPS